MKNKSQTIIYILNVITVICSLIALILFLNGGVDFENPIMWIMCLLLFSSSTSLITQIINCKKK